MEISVDLRYTDEELNAVAEGWDDGTGKDISIDELKQLIQKRVEVLESRLSSDLDWHLNNPNGLLFEDR